MKYMLLTFFLCFQLTSSFGQFTVTTSSNNTNTKQQDTPALQISVQEKAYGAMISYGGDLTKVRKIILEKRNSGKAYQPLKTIELKSNLSGSKIYTTKDLNVKPGHNHYRITWTDASGKEHKSKEKILVSSKKNNFTVTTMPGNEILEINLTASDKGSIRIFDSHFALMETIPLAGNQESLSVDISGYKSGEYIVQKQTKDSNYMKSFVKE